MLWARSWLYVSGARPEHFDKALRSAADAVVFDLEDSVLPAGKAAARAAVGEFLSSADTTRVFVRVNGVNTTDHEADIAALRSVDLAGIRLPKAESVDEIRQCARHLQKDGRTLEIQPIIESARGFVNLPKILADRRVHRVCVGESDLAADLNLGDRSWLDHLRMEVVVQSRAADCAPPIQGVFSKLPDRQGLERSTRRGRAMGFFGRSVVHPDQIDVVNSIFLPQPTEVEWAQSTIHLVSATEGETRAGYRADDGTFVDLATVRRAERVLAAARRQEGDA